MNAAGIARAMEGHRKLAAFALYVLAYVTLALCGVKARMVYEGLTYGLAIVVLGNAAEWATKRPKAAAP